MYIVFERKDFDRKKFPFFRPLSEAEYEHLTEKAKRVVEAAELTHILIDGERLTAIPFADYVKEVPKC